MGLLATKRPIVLIVEDEFLIRMNALEMIEAAGFEVIEASSADAAIDILHARSDIAIVFTDIQMPGSMDGLRLAASGTVGLQSGLSPHRGNLKFW